MGVRPGQLNKNTKNDKKPVSNSVYNTKKSSDRRLAMGNRISSSSPSASLGGNVQMDQDTLDKVVSFLNKLKQRRADQGKDQQNNKNNKIKGKDNKIKGLSTGKPQFKLFVGNLSLEVTEEMVLYTLIKLNIGTGSLLDVNIVKDKGYGFLIFEDANDYLECFKKLNNKYIGLKPVTLSRAKS